MTEEYTIGELEKKIGYQFRDKSGWSFWEMLCWS